MRIIQIGPFPVDEMLIKGGEESSVYGLTNMLKYENEVCVLVVPINSVSKDYTVQDDNIIIHYFRNYIKNNLGSLLRIKRFIKIIKAYKPEICHLHSTSAFTFILLLYLRFKRIPYIVTVHGLLHIEQKNNLKKGISIRSLFKYIWHSFFEFMTLNLTSKIIVDTLYVANEIIKYKKKGKLIRLPEFIIIPQGINVDFFSVPDHYQQNQILSVGGIGPRKGYLFSIKAIEKVKKQFPHIKYTIIGTVSDRNYLLKLETYLKENDLENNISILTNKQFEDLKRYYEKCNIFILHSQEESQGIVFSEAMACGKPIVATNVGGIPHVLKNNYNAYLSEYKDIDTFADNILKLLANENLRTILSERNKQSGKDYSWKFISEKILKVYIDICGY